MLMVLGAIVIFGIGMMVFLSSKGTTKRTMVAEAAKPNLGRVTGTTAPGDLIPSDKVKPSPDEAKKGGTVDAADIEKTKSPKIAQPLNTNKQSAPNSGKELNQVGKFEEPDTTPSGQYKWAPPPYAGGQGEQQALKKEEDALSKPSLVFTAHNQSNNGLRSGTQRGQQSVNNLGLAPGYHVAARLESMATTAVHAPVTAVVEYNYERDGEVLIPAGSHIVGKITQADPSGLVNITFASLEFPGGDTVPIDAVGADMNLEAIKGKVTGKRAGKSLLVRSLSGIGETAAMIVGAPSGNAAFSEDDLLRMRMADNIGNAGDEQIMQMMTMQHIVVSVPAGTEIYVIFEKSQLVDATGAEKIVHIPHLDSTALNSDRAVER
ncbi:MAG TPA: TrbI/VirB10 family protein [Acidobacteriaceae bacterium]|nr:TrbI/VirB10 family protein [Acidobacteriaceae bacterium]